MNEYKTISHCKYLCQYHVVWCPKFRFNILENIERSLRHIFQEIAEQYQYEIIEMEIMPDHIHLFIGSKPTVSPSDIVRTLKSISDIELFKQYPSLKQFYSQCGSLWSVGKFISTIGKVSEATVKRYIQEQKGGNVNS